MPAFTESVVEDAALACLESLGWQIAHGPDIAAGERADCGEAALARHLRDGLARRNRAISAEGIEDAEKFIGRAG